MTFDYYIDKARDIVWGCIDNNKLIYDDNLEKSVTGIVAKLLETIGEVAELFRFKKQSIYNMVHENRIPYIKVGNAVRFKDEDIKEILKCVEVK